MQKTQKLKIISKRGDLMNIDMIRGDTLNVEFEIDSDTVLELSSDNFIRSSFKLYTYRTSVKE